MRASCAPAWNAALASKRVTSIANALASAAAMIILVAGTAETAMAAPRGGVQVQDDKFSPAASFTGPSDSVNPFGGTFRLWFLRAAVNKSDGTAVYQLYVDTNYLWHWRFWEMAADDHAVLHPVVQIAQSVDDCSGGVCSYSETLGVSLDEAFLEARSDGFEIKLTAKSGDTLVLPVSGPQIAPLLKAVDTYRQGLSRAAASSLTPNQGVGASAAASEPRRLTLGVQFVDLSPALATAVGRTGLKGVIIVAVRPGSVAERGGLAQGDIVTDFASKPIASLADLTGAVQSVAPGATVIAHVVRAGKDLDVSLQF